MATAKLNRFGLSCCTRLLSACLSNGWRTILPAVDLTHVPAVYTAFVSYNSSTYCCRTACTYVAVLSTEQLASLEERSRASISYVKGCPNKQQPTSHLKMLRVQGRCHSSLIQRSYCSYVRVRRQVLLHYLVPVVDYALVTCFLSRTVSVGRTL